MSRGKSQALIRDLIPDPVYGSKIISKMINYFMVDGKKSTAAGIIYGAIDRLEADIKRINDEFNTETSVSQERCTIFFFEYILSKVAMSVEVKSRRVGGSNCRVPCAVPEKNIPNRAMGRIRDGTRNRKEKGTLEKLVAEIRGILSGASEALKSRETAQKDVESNRAFAHYASRFS